MLGSVLLGIGDIEFALQILNVKGGKPGRDIRVRKGTGGEADRSKALVEHVDGASMEISSVEKVTRGSAADGQPFVDRAGAGVIHGEDGSGGKGGRRGSTTRTRRRDTRVPAGDRAVFGSKNEEAWTGAAAFGNDEVGRTVKDLAGGRAGPSTAWRWRDGNHQRNGLTSTGVEGSDASPVV